MSQEAHKVVRGGATQCDHTCSETRVDRPRSCGSKVAQQEPLALFQPVLVLEKVGPYR